MQPETRQMWKRHAGRLLRALLFVFTGLAAAFRHGSDRLVRFTKRHPYATTYLTLGLLLGILVGWPLILGAIGFALGYGRSLRRKEPETEVIGEIRVTAVLKCILDRQLENAHPGEKTTFSYELQEDDPEMMHRAPRKSALPNFAQFLSKGNGSGSLGKSAIPGRLSNVSGSGRNARPTFR